MKKPLSDQCILQQYKGKKIIYENNGHARQGTVGVTSDTYVQIHDVRFYILGVDTLIEHLRGYETGIITEETQPSSSARQIIENIRDISSIVALDDIQHTSFQ